MSDSSFRCRPSLAALATLLTTWIHNDFLWAITLISHGNKRPITSELSLGSFKG